LDIRNENNKQLKIMRENFKSLREANGWSFKDLSHITGIDEKTLTDIEEGEDFNVQYLIELCRIYHIKYFLTLIDQPKSILGDKCNVGSTKNRIRIPRFQAQRVSKGSQPFASF